MAQEIITSWQRLEQVVKWSGMSTNRFAMAVGLKRSENLYQIKRGNFGISKELARLICLKYPMVSRLWLLTGEGEMLEGAVTAASIIESRMTKGEGVVPFYDVDVTEVATKEARARHKALYHMLLPSIPDCDFAAQSKGGAMSPEIPAGATVILKEVTIDTVLLGEAYLIVADGISAIRYVRSMDGHSSKWQLVPRNTTDYDTMTVERSKVKAVYALKAIINYRTA